MIFIFSVVGPTESHSVHFGTIFIQFVCFLFNCKCLPNQEVRAIQDTNEIDDETLFVKTEVVGKYRNDKTTFTAYTYLFYE